MTKSVCIYIGFGVTQTPISELQREEDSEMLKKKVEKVMVKTAEELARHGVSVACGWILYQPKVPAKVTQKFKKK